MSGGELFRALRAGIDPKKIVYAGVGKRRDEIEYALKIGILMFNVESGDELRALDDAAGEMRATARIALRVNPNIDPKTHAYISTGLKENKFGIPIEQALEYYQMARSLSHVEIVGVHHHIGSQITEVQPFVDALEKVVGFVKELKSAGMNIKYIDIGGGLGITYKDETPPLPRELATAIQPLLKDCGCTLVLEPGRAIVGNAGILVTSVLYHKDSGEKKFLIVDAGMNDLIRPSLYEAYHEIKPVVEPAAQDGMCSTSSARSASPAISWPKSGKCRRSSAGTSSPSWARAPTASPCRQIIIPARGLPKSWSGEMNISSFANAKPTTTSSRARRFRGGWRGRRAFRISDLRIDILSEVLVGTMKKIPFYKMQGSGNDFILIDNRRNILKGKNLKDLATTRLPPALFGGRRWTDRYRSFEEGRF